MSKHAYEFFPKTPTPEKRNLISQSINTRAKLDKSCPPKYNFYLFVGKYSTAISTRLSIYYCLPHNTVMGCGLFINHRKRQRWMAATKPKKEHTHYIRIHGKSAKICEEAFPLINGPRVWSAIVKGRSLLSR